MANRGDARSGHLGGDGACIRGDAVVDAAVCLCLDFIFNLPGGDAQAWRGRDPYTDSMPHYILRRRVWTSGNWLELNSLVRRQRDCLWRDRSVRQLVVPGPGRADPPGV